MDHPSANLELTVACHGPPQSGCVEHRKAQPTHPERPSLEARLTPRCRPNGPGVPHALHNRPGLFLRSKRDQKG